MSSSFIQEIKKEHLFILDTLEGVMKAGVGTHEAREKLRQAKTKLLSHLTKEDELIYPALADIAADDAALKQTLDVMAKELSDISRLVADFFAKYIDGREAEARDSLDFATDFGRIYSALCSRVTREENLFYDKYRDELERRLPPGAYW